VTGLDALDADMEDHLASLGDDPLRRRWLDQGKRNDETRRILAESAAVPDPDVTPEQRAAFTAARWQQLGEGTDIPDEARAVLLQLLAAGTTISAAATALDASRWVARTYLERLRTEGLAELAGKGRGARWVTPPQDVSGDGS
jgi:DNA-directed RNA polymerase specialized sigma24 family protein